MTTTTALLPETESMLCGTHGRVLARLVRGAHLMGTLRVDDALAYICPECEAVLAFPQASSGRIAAAWQRNAPPRTLELRVPRELEDLALAVHASLGTLGAGETFTLPLHLGLQVAGRAEKPRASWRGLDGRPCEHRARPRVTDLTKRRLEGLQEAWGARSVAEVARWLVVAAWEATCAGLTHEGAPRSHGDYDETVVESAFEQLAGGGAASRGPSHLRVVSEKKDAA